MLVSLAVYAKMHGKHPASVRQKAERKGFKTAVKIGRNWVIDCNEPYVNLNKNQNKSEEKEMKRISIDNGATYITPAEAIATLNDWDLIAMMMDDEIREQVHSELAPCTDLEFLVRYLELAEEDLIIG